MSANTLFISDVMLKERTTIHGNIDPKLIYSDIKTAQDMYVHPILGTALYIKLQTIIDDGTISSDATKINYKNLLDLFIVDTLIYYTLSQLPVSLSFQFWNKGVVRKVGENTELPSMSELLDISNNYLNKAEHYAKRLRLYLRDKAPSMFPEYLNPGSTIDTIVPEQNDFSMPVYLGDEGRNPYCNRGGFNGQPYSD